MRQCSQPSGMTAKETTDMTNQISRMMQLTAPLSGRAARHAAILAMAVIGAGIIGVAGNLQAASLHDAAHDVRHATGFPCH